MNRLIDLELVRKGEKKKKRLTSSLELQSSTPQENELQNLDLGYVDLHSLIAFDFNRRCNFGSFKLCD